MPAVGHFPAGGLQPFPIENVRHQRHGLPALALYLRDDLYGPPLAAAEYPHLRSGAGEPAGDLTLPAQDHGISCWRSRFLNAPADRLNSAGPLKPEYVPEEARCGSKEKKPSNPEACKAEMVSRISPSPSPAGTTVPDPKTASLTCTYST